MITKIRYRVFYTFAVYFYLLMVSSIVNLTIIVAIFDETDDRFKFKLFLFLILLGLNLLLYYTLKKVITKTPIVKFNDRHIWINRTKYNIEDINSFSLSGKYRYLRVDGSSSMNSVYREGMKMVFKNGNELYLFDEFYKNLNDLKIKLNHGVNQPINILNEYRLQKTYNRSQFMTPRGIFMWTFIVGLFVYNCSNLYEIFLFSQLLQFLSVIFILWYNSSLMSYFIMDNETILVRKTNMFWYKKKFNFENISEIVFDFYTIPPRHQVKVCELRVILKDFTQHRFPARNFTDKQWESLEDDLINRGVKFRNDREIRYETDYYF